MYIDDTLGYDESQQLTTIEANKSKHSQIGNCDGKREKSMMYYRYNLTAI